MKARWRMFGSLLVCLILVIGLLSPLLADRTVSSSLATTDAASDGPPLRLSVATFDPVVDSSPVGGTEVLQLSTYPGDGAGYYIVQFQGPIAASDVDALEATGVEVFDYIPDYAFIVKMDDVSRAAVEEMAQVRWVGLYQPAYRLTPDLLARSATTPDAARTPQTAADGKVGGPVGLSDDGPMTLVVSVFRGEALAPVKARIEGLGGVILDESQTEWKSKLKVSLPADALAEVAAIPGVRWIEPAPQWQLANDVADNVMGVREVWDTEGLYGTGQTVAVCDTGLDQGSAVPASLHDDFENGSGASRVVAIYDRASDGANDVNSGHGTHVAGSVLGNGDLSGATPSSHTYPESAYVGAAPEASLIFQAVENNTSGALSGIPLDLNTLFAQADSGGADLHTNSWGSEVSGMYTTSSEDVDEYVWDHKDFAIFFSAANAGIDNNADGVVDFYSMGSPATAKNCVTVGASENDRPGISSTWGGMWPDDFPANPVYDDPSADDPAGLAAFSSRGPALDGRFKPDIVAPGTWIASTKSSATSSTGWGAIDSNYTYMGGTSMATPLTAGAAALVRQFYTDRESITPSAALIKATMVNGATDIFPGQYGTGGTQEIATRRPTNVAGWGRVNVQDSIFPTGPRTMAYVDQNTGLNTGNSDTYNYTVTGSGEPLKVTLAWSDYPGSPVAAGGLVNDLDLTVTGPGGTIYYPNNANQRGASQEIAYDNGYGSGSWVWNAGNQVAVRFAPAQYPADLQTGLFYLSAASYPKTFDWYVYAGSPTGPTTVLASGSSTIRSKGWHAIDFSAAGVTIASGDFFLAIELPDDQLAWFYDDSLPDNRSWGYDSSTWSVNTTEDYLFHAVVSRPDVVTQQDRVNNLVGIDIPSPTTGIYTVTVSGFNVPQGPQPYALVVSGLFETVNTAPTLSGIPNLNLGAGESRDNAVDLWAYASDTLDSDADLTFSITNSPPAGAGVSLDSDRYIDINPTSGYTGTVSVEVEVMDTGGLTDTDTFEIVFEETYTVYLPMVLRCYPLAPFLQPISNADGDGLYTLNWSMSSCGGTTSEYEIQGATNPQFSDAQSEATTATSMDIYWSVPGIHYWRVRAYVNDAWMGWSNVRSVSVGTFSYVFIDNDTGSTLTLEIVGVETRAFPAGFDDFWRSIPVGTYTVKAAAACGSSTDVYDFPLGIYTLRYYCGVTALSMSIEPASLDTHFTFEVRAP